MRSASGGHAVLDMRGVEVRLRAGAGGCVVDVRALVGIDLRARAGERMLVVGERASGKTVLLLTAAGLLPPCRGRVVRVGEARVIDESGVRAVGGRRARGAGAALLLADDVRGAAELRRLCALADGLDAALLVAAAAGSRAWEWAGAAPGLRALRLDGGRLREVVDAGASLAPAPKRSPTGRVASVAEPS